MGRKAAIDGQPRRAVVGAGMWGTTLALQLARTGPVLLLTRDGEHARQIAQEGQNQRHLPGFVLPTQVQVDHRPEALASADQLVIFAAASSGMRDAAERVAAHVHREALLVSVAKGIERRSLLRMTEVLGQVVPESRHRLAALSGPNLALEIARGLPASAVVGAADEDVGGRVVDMLATRTFRLYRNRDVIGVELCGALKNIIAIAAGAAEQLGFGDNGKAGLITRGLAEMTRLGMAAGANPLTFAGLAGLGDVVATCFSPLSRNHRLGVELARGRRWAEIEGTLPGVAEGAYTVTAALDLASRLGVQMPIAEEVRAGIFEGKNVRRCVIDLLSREQKDELAGLDWAPRGRPPR
ncbi:MAG TPA: NAD(P)H-dependent glycerol-3-phosphate dehydrogenase [Candidatus Limnocylindrales bacterium]|nr:NAD(P)H-dependent glycerol-3-phosphate dehydrogenase [Candidatus Limnocylindrales bacterium]